MVHYFDTVFVYHIVTIVVLPAVLAPSSSEELSLPLSLADSELGALPNSAPAPVEYSTYSTLYTV
jgi:hypothetical protein